MLAEDGKDETNLMRMVCSEIQIIELIKQFKGTLLTNKANQILLAICR